MTPPDNNPPAPGRKRLAICLVFLFCLAMLMGPGPGLRLVNPPPDAARESYLLAGVPLVYAWGLFWYAVQAGVVATAYFTVWRSPENGPPAED